jgi:hypothetical protein
MVHFQMGPSSLSASRTPLKTTRSDVQEGDLNELNSPRPRT